MDPVGPTISIASLASLFEAALHCFEYVELGKNLGVDFKTCTLKLDNACLQLTRWGEAVGLSEGTKTTRSLDEASLPKKKMSNKQKLCLDISWSCSIGQNRWQPSTEPKQFYRDGRFRHGPRGG